MAAVSAKPRPELSAWKEKRRMREEKICPLIHFLLQRRRGSRSPRHHLGEEPLSERDCLNSPVSARCPGERETRSIHRSLSSIYSPCELIFPLLHFHVRHQTQGAQSSSVFTEEAPPLSPAPASIITPDLWRMPPESTSPPSLTFPSAH